MITKHILIGLVTGVFCGALALQTATANETSHDAEYETLGGTLRRPGTGEGRVVYVNCQKRIPESALRVHAANIVKDINCCIDVEPGSFTLSKPKVVGNATLFVVDDPALPTLLSAPEDRWCVVNIARLAADGSDDATFRMRAAKELSRGIAILCGAFQSQFQDTLMECVTEPKQLDKYAGESLPFDALIAMGTYLKGYGVKPFEPVNYFDACYEGWAPAPKDDVQRRIKKEAAEVRAQEEAAKNKKK